MAAALRMCGQCGERVSAAAGACSHCGFKRSPGPVMAEGSGMPVWPWVVGAVVVLFVFLGTAGNSPEATEKQRQRDIIEMCWKDQNRKSLTPGEGRFIASACESIESKFLQKFGHKP